MFIINPKKTLYIAIIITGEVIAICLIYNS